jgi:hypothetical protein
MEAAQRELTRRIVDYEWSARMYQSDHFGDILRTTRAHCVCTSCGQENPIFCHAGCACMMECQRSSRALAPVRPRETCSEHRSMHFIFLCFVPCKFIKAFGKAHSCSRIMQPAISARQTTNKELQR